MPAFPAPTLDTWQPSLRREPVVRIGVVLDEDACQTLHLVLPDEAYDLRIADGAVSTIAPGARITIQRQENAVRVQVHGHPARTTARLVCAPRAPRDLSADVGVLVRDVVAGRGFHWQRRIDQRLSGVLVITAGSRGLILVNELPLDDYLAGVITAEMSGACPAAFLRAQCVVARSWLLAGTEDKHPDQPFDRCNDDCCQRYQGTGDLSAAAFEASHGTRGRVLLTSGGDVVDANYAKSCGGISEAPVAVWGVDKPGLRPVVDAPPGDAAQDLFPVTPERVDNYFDGSWIRSTRAWCSPQVVPPDELGRYLGRVDIVDDYFRWSVRYDRDQLVRLLASKLEALKTLEAVRALRVARRGPGGRVSHLDIDWVDHAGNTNSASLDSEYRIRAALHERFLYSSAFALQVDRDPRGDVQGLTLRGAGWGHGVGLCQIGALGMALSGESYDAICQHYYPDSRLDSVYA